MRPIDAVPAESSAGHKAGRECDCGPVAMRDLATGSVSVWRHHRFLPDKREPAPIPSDVTRVEPRERSRSLSRAAGRHPPLGSGDVLTGGADG